jgi:uncharacterized protein
MRYPMRSYTGGDKTGLVVPLIALLCLGSLAEARSRDYAPFPNPDAGYVTDIAGLLTKDQEQQLERWLLQTEKRSGVEIIVVTIQSMKGYPGTPNRSIEEFARVLFDAYGIGNMPKNNGVLLLVAAQDRRAKIVLGAGYGYARDNNADRIMEREIVPCFRREQYAQGIVSGVKALIREFGGAIFVPGWLPWAVGGSILILIPFAISLFRNGKRGWGWVVAGLIIILLLVMIWLIRRVSELASDRGAYASGGLGEYGGGAPDGLGGFGGGFSGGGGATGSW